MGENKKQIEKIDRQIGISLQQLASVYVSASFFLFPFKNIIFFEGTGKKM